jgi:zinc D-Ala-D-Ala carboxypeptidase
MDLTKNVSLKELTKSESATRFGISNEPTEEALSNLQKLATHILQPVRDHFGKPLIITSGYRSPELCVKIGSTTTSQHTKGQASDFEIGGIANKDLSDWIHQNLDYDQLILEFWKPEDPNSGWVHCSYKGEGQNRKQYLRAFTENGKTKYEPMI